jgi:hypothetical protein
MKNNFFSNTPYSEPDNDYSPCNDIDWDWGGGGNKARRPGYIHPYKVI